MIKIGQTYQTSDKRKYIITDVKEGFVSFKYEPYSIGVGDFTFTVRDISAFMGWVLDGTLTLTDEAGCSHEFKLYQGLIETYQYCICCDMKQEAS